MIHTLLKDAAAGGAGDAVQIDRSRGMSHTVVAQAEVAAGEVKLQGRVSVDAPWEDLATFTASGAEEVPKYPYMRGERVSGTVSLWIAE